MVWKSFGCMAVAGSRQVKYRPLTLGIAHTDTLWGSNLSNIVNIPEEGKPGAELYKS